VRSLKVIKSFSRLPYGILQLLGQIAKPGKTLKRFVEGRRFPWSKNIAREVIPGGCCQSNSVESHLPKSLRCLLRIVLLRSDVALHPGGQVFTTWAAEECSKDKHGNHVYVEAQIGGTPEPGARKRGIETLHRL
jgi:hypothetical protein